LLKVAKNQDQLATVIGHEVGHVIAKHGAERVSDQMAAELAASGVGAALGVGTQGVVLKFSRTQESEADLIGLDRMAAAGFDPHESVPLWENMAAASKGNRPPEFL